MEEIDHPNRKYSVLSMSEAIARGDGEDTVISTFKDSCLSTEHLILWRHPELGVNILQFAILYQRPDVVQSIGNMWPYFLMDKHIYECDKAFIAELSDKQLEEVEDVMHEFLLNPPLHLACIVGCIDSIKFLLGKKCNFYLSKNAFINVVENKTEDLSMKWISLPGSKVKTGKPFELCVAAGHIDCLSYLMNNVITQCLALKFLYTDLQESSSMLHTACSIGYHPLVKLLLDNAPQDAVGVCDKNGKTPLHLAVWNGDTQTISLLLERGALVNATTESKGCFHILFRSKFNPFKYFFNTRLLIRYGIDVHMKDKNGASALHVLAEEIGQSEATMCWWKASKAITETTSSIYREPTEYGFESYYDDLVRCLKTLLEQGINPANTSPQSTGIETVIERLLQFSSLPHSQMIFKKPRCVYKVLELLLSHNANSNMASHFPDMSLFTYFILHHLEDIQDEDMKHKFVHLFSLYGADMDGLFSALCYPLVAAVEKATPLNVIALIGNLMSTRHLITAMATIQHCFIQSLLHSVIPSEVQYARGIIQLFEQLRPRSLKHISKVSIRKLLHRPIVDVQNLPLPASVKQYVISDAF